MNKISRISRCFRIFFLFLFIALPIMQIIGWIYAPASLSFFQHAVVFEVVPKPYQVLHVLSVTERIEGFLISMIPTGIDLSILYFLIKLFGLYEKEEIFSLVNVSYIKKIAYALLIGQVVNPIYYGLMGLALTWHNPPGHRFASIVWDQTNASILIVAFLTILIAWIMAEGARMREEQQLTI